MKKLFVRIVSILGVVVCVLNFVCCAGPFSHSCAMSENTDFYLLCGLDDCAQNTDVIILSGYNQNDNTGFFIHIPRDTFFSSSGESGKINSVFSSAISKGHTAEYAVEKLCGIVQTIFDIDIDGYLCFTSETFKNIIDEFDGVEIFLDQPLQIKNSSGDIVLDLKKGKNFLNGDESLKFIRYRAGYALGDLARIDAQKIFISSILSKVRSSMDFKTAANVLFGTSNNILTNCAFSDVYNIAIKNLGRIKNVRLLYTNLPGQSLRGEDGAWYYIANKAATEQMIREIGIKNKRFDKNNILLDSNNKDFENIYLSKKIGYKIYTDADLKNLHIIQK